MNSLTSEQPARTIRLTSGVFRLDQQEQTVRVVYGFAWVTTGEQDILLTRGEEVHLMPENEAVLIEALEQRPLLFQIFPN